MCFFNMVINSSIVPFLKNYFMRADHTTLINNNRKNNMDDDNFISTGLDAYSFSEDIDSLYENGLRDNELLQDLYRDLENYDRGGARDDLSN